MGRLFKSVKSVDWKITAAFHGAGVPTGVIINQEDHSFTGACLG